MVVMDASVEQAERMWIDYEIDEAAGRARVVEKLIAGELRSTCLPRGAPPDQPPVDIHRERWHILIPDWAASSASAAGEVLDGILVYMNEPPTSDDASPTPDAAAWAVDPPGPKPGRGGSAKDAMCRLTIEIMEGPEPIERKRGWRTRLAGQVTHLLKAAGHNYKRESVSRIIRGTLADWEKRHPEE